MKITLYHGTSEKNAKEIEKYGFAVGKKYNWKVKSKDFVYLASAYAPFYAMAADNEGSGLALIKVEVHEKDLYPDEDYVMFALGKKTYSQEELDLVDLKDFKKCWKKSLKYLGNAAAKPDKIKILGIRYFNGKGLLNVCDPCITPLNFMIMGDYYKKLTEYIFEGNEISKFGSFMEVTNEIHNK